MKTITVSQLKTHLGTELKLVPEGLEVVVLDHRHPDIFEPLAPLTNRDPLQTLDMERQDYR